MVSGRCEYSLALIYNVYVRLEEKARYRSELFISSLGDSVFVICVRYLWMIRGGLEEDLRRLREFLITTKDCRIRRSRSLPGKIAVISVTEMDVALLDCTARKL